MSRPLSHNGSVKEAGELGLIAWNFQYHLAKKLNREKSALTNRTSSKECEGQRLFQLISPAKQV